MDRIAVYSWVNDNTIPYYKQGKTLMFKKPEIDKWLHHTRVKDNTELMEEAQHYCAKKVAGMEKINVAMIPAVLAGIVKQLEAIDGWLTLKTEPVLNGTIGPQEDWIDIYELRRMIPGDPKIELFRSWLYFHGIPLYKSGRTTLFRRQEIEAWIERSQQYGNGDFWTKKRKYKEQD